MSCLAILSVRRRLNAGIELRVVAVLALVVVVELSNRKACSYCSSDGMKLWLLNSVYSTVACLIRRVWKANKAVTSSVSHQALDDDDDDDDDDALGGEASAIILKLGCISTT